MRQQPMLWVAIGFLAMLGLWWLWPYVGLSLSLLLMMTLFLAPLGFLWLAVRIIRNAWKGH